jgi:prepilin-type N-terminal cleavage/methylation domain-containing protein
MRTRTLGYSLLELMVVLAIIGLIAVVAVPAVGASVGRMTLQSDARVVALGLRAARDRAMDTQADIAVSVAGNVLSTSDGQTIMLAAGTVAKATPALLVTWDGRVSGRVRLTRGGASLAVTADRLTGRLRTEAVR